MSTCKKEVDRSPVCPDLTLERFVEDYLLRSAQSAWSVVEDGRAVGIIAFDDARTPGP